ncbi:MAG: hypothetical protein JNM56_06020 [Planctomycetia bacterium]|nr:hypothetical protein [Planctomycetia bacterium]
MSGLNRFLIEDVEVPLVAVLADLEDAGYRVDVPHFEQLSQVLETELNEVVAQLRDHAGADFNPNSHDQVRTFLFETLKLPPLKETAQRSASTDQETLEALKAAHPAVPLLSRFRALTKLHGTYCKVPTQLDDDGRYHPVFDQLGAETGRISSKGIIQTIPKHDAYGIRRGFIADPGHQIVAADFVQRELCVLAGVSGDPVLQQAILNGVDLHGLAAVKVFSLDCAPQDVKAQRPAERDRVKAIQFGIIYGQSAAGLASTLDLTLDEANQLLDHYFAQFPDVRGFINDVHQRVCRDGFIDDLFGRRRYLPDAQLARSRRKNERMSGSERDLVRRYKAAQRAAQNFVIQGASATITKLAMLRCHRHLCAEHPRIRFLLTLHDELHFEVPDDEVQHFVSELPDLMCRLDLERFGFTLPLTAEVKAGPSWGALRPVAPQG